MFRTPRDPCAPCLSWFDFVARVGFKSAHAGRPAKGAVNLSPVSDRSKYQTACGADRQGLAPLGQLFKDRGMRDAILRLQGRRTNFFPPARPFATRSKAVDPSDSDTVSRSKASNPSRIITARLASWAELGWTYKS